MSEKTQQLIVVTLSILLPVLVTLIYFFPTGVWTTGFDIYLLPAFHAIVNASTAVMLILGYIFIRQQKRKAHRFAMLTAVGFSVLFLLSYVAYHSQAAPTSYGGEGFMKSVYYFVLITHIILAAVIVPLVLITLFRGLSAKYDKHRKIARWTLPLWLYVAVSGVIVYLMISPYYQ